MDKPKTKSSNDKEAEAIDLFSEKKYSEAINLIDSVYEVHQNKSLLLNIKGACYNALEDFQSAIDSYESAIKIDSKNYKAHYNLAGTYHELSELDAAVKSYNNSIKIQPEFDEAHNNLGNVYREQGRLNEALASFKKALKISPGYLEAHYSMGLVFQEIGRLAEAVGKFKKVLSIKPEFAELHINVGVLLQELDKKEEALQHFEKAINIKPDSVEANNNLGNIFRDKNIIDKAIQYYKRAISLKPDYFEAIFNLGVIYQEQNQFKKALKIYKKALSYNPNYLEALNNIGVTYKELGKLNESVESLSKALLINPNYIEANYNLGATYLELQQYDSALKQYQASLSLNPQYAEAHNNLGIVFKEMSQLNDSEKSYRRALSINSNYAEAHNNLGNLLKLKGKPHDAINCYKKTLEINPLYFEAHNNLGITLMKIGKLSESVISFKTALSVKQNYKEAFNNLGISYNMLGMLNESKENYENAILIDPSYAEAYSNLGNLMIDLKDVDGAVRNYEEAYQLKPEIAFNLGNLLHTKMHLIVWEKYKKYLNEIILKLNNKDKAIDPFSLLAIIDDPELHKKAAQIYIDDKYPLNLDLPKIGLYPRHKKIRIGYFSPDFRVHPVANLTAELYETHDRSKFEVYAFSFGPDTGDEMNLRIKAGVDYFHDVQTMSHKEVASLSRSLELDIAIDLGGFTQDTRTEIFAMQAAPIQVNYLGYSSTMGADYMNYIIADKTLIPEDKKKYYSEKIVYLPDSFMVNDTKNKISKRVFTRQEVKLPEKGFVFSCFNHHYKITPSVFASWMKILSKVDGSVLWLSDGNTTGIENLKKEAKKNNIDESRLIIAPRLDLREDHLNRIKLADLFLDTLPYNAHATTSDALQVGLPVLTRIGASFASRVAASLISSVDMMELITESQEQYEELAIELATNTEKLKAIKDKLEVNLKNSPLYNTPLYTKQLEAAYLAMYERYQNELDPDHIYV